MPLIFLSLLARTTVSAQENILGVFDNLVGKTWKAEGIWGNGTGFKQEITFNYALDSTLIITKTKGFTNQEQTKFGSRNHGVRKLNSETKTLAFWEFDVFGGVTKGTIRAEGKDLWYHYTYGESTVTDLWHFVDPYTYDFKVGVYENGEWEAVYLETQFKSRADFKYHFDHQSLVVVDLMKTGDFYRDILKLEEIPHPEKAPGFRWFNIYGTSQLHLIKKDVVEFKKDKSIHFCLSVEDLEAFIVHLIANDITFYDWPGNKNSVTNRADGVQQIYFEDPEGYWIEINTAPHD